MNLIEERRRFEKNYVEIESAVLKFYGVDGFDVYNCSLPFWFQGKRYLFGRVERRNEWMRSWVRMFEECGQDEWRLVPDSMIYQLEDPYIAQIKDEFVLGGTHVRVKSGTLDTYYGYFYKGKDIQDLYYFTTGPDYMKDIRLVELANGKIGVFSRPRDSKVMETYGSESMIGFTTINSLEELTGEVISSAAYVDGLLETAQWGGCNQAYLLESGDIGVIGHICYAGSSEVSTYMNMAFVLNPDTREAKDLKIIGTRSQYPVGPAKKPDLIDCAFTTGFVMREDGMADLYSGIGDCAEGRIVIPYPFEGHGRIVEKEAFIPQ